MKRLKYPVCEKCDAEINPNKYDDCEQYYLIGEETYCRECFKDWLLEQLDSVLDDVAALVGVAVVEV